MRVTQVLYKQPILLYFKKHWRVQGKKKIARTSAFQHLAEKNIPIYDPKDILKEQKVHEIVNVVGLVPEPIKFDKTHPDWHDRICLTYKDNNVLLEGLAQAKSLTKTVEIRQGLPEHMTLVDTKRDIDKIVQSIILSSHIFDAEQVKLPKVKDPERPAWNFPRLFGITDKRRNLLITSKLLQLVESLNKPQITNQRYLLNNVHFSFPFEKRSELIQLSLRGDMLLTSSIPLKHVTTSNGIDMELPQLHPVLDTATLNKENIYQLNNVYPIKTSMSKRHPHTIFANYNETEVQNIYEEEVTEEQILGRTLMKAFTVAASYAKEKYGNVKLLPEPVTLQCVHADGRFFHFGIIQLNTLDLDTEEGVKNIWYQTPRIPLFDKCAYILGKPILEGYNNEVIKHLLTFYNNI